MDASESDRLSQLPVVVLDNIIQDLDPKSILALRATNELLAKVVESNAERLMKRYLSVLKTTQSSLSRLQILYQGLSNSQIVQLPDHLDIWHRLDVNTLNEQLSKNDPDHPLVIRYFLALELVQLPEIVRCTKVILDFVSDEDKGLSHPWVPHTYHYAPGVIPLTTQLNAWNRKAWMKEQKSFEMANLLWRQRWKYWKEKKTDPTVNYFQVMSQELNVPEEKLVQIIAEASKVEKGLRECEDFCPLLSEFFY